MEQDDEQEGLPKISPNTKRPENSYVYTQYVLGSGEVGFLPCCCYFVRAVFSRLMYLFQVIAPVPHEARGEHEAASSPQSSPGATGDHQLEQQQRRINLPEVCTNVGVGMTYIQ